MDIGKKLKAARTDAGLTQEQAAERLGVSRQTVSNWETGKTYPDIVSVVKMSDLFHISLDRLLKEEEHMNDYLNYLEESTDTVRTRRRLLGAILAGVYLLIWGFALIVFWFFSDPADAMGYSIMFLWVLLPLLTFVLSLLIGENGLGGRKNAWVSLLFGVMFMGAEYATFTAANWHATGNPSLPDFSLLGIGTAISLLGIFAGRGIRRLMRRNNEKS